MSGIGREPMLDLYLFEASQLMEQLEGILLGSEKNGTMTTDQVDEIFRIMHTVKGSSAMMMFNGIAALAHKVEDLFYFIREKKPRKYNHAEVTDAVLGALDFIRGELEKLEAGNTVDGDASRLSGMIEDVLGRLRLKQGAGDAPAVPPQEDTPARFYISSYAPPGGMAPAAATERRYVLLVRFEEGCQMENVRAYTLLHALKDVCSDIRTRPADVLEEEDACERIVQDGFLAGFSTSSSLEDIRRIVEEALFVSRYELDETDEYDALFPQAHKGHPAAAPTGEVPEPQEGARVSPNAETAGPAADTASRGTRQNLVSVNVQKLDKLMDLVGEIVITESMVTMNPDLAGLRLDNFSKAARQLRKLTDELQDIVMSVRMIPIAGTFSKMNRIVRDMGRKLGKEAELVLLGEETEVDKNIIDNLGDPLMHLIRNAMDHGIEPAEVRRAAGKPEAGRLVLEARNSGGDVEILLSDDGRGMNREDILRKAKENGLLDRPEAELTDRDVFQFILLPGFSTKEQVTEFSGRGVGMDVVKRNIEKLGGTVAIDSTPGKGTTMGIRIPLTLAIVNGMEIKVGNALYTLPIPSIRESFRVEAGRVFTDVRGNEMLLIRGECVPVIRLHRAFRVRGAREALEEGIMVMVEGNGRTACLYADELLGEQQVVVKPLPTYIQRFATRDVGIGGCTILGDGSISLIIDVPKTLGQFV